MGQAAWEADAEGGAAQNRQAVPLPGFCRAARSCRCMSQMRGALFAPPPKRPAQTAVTDLTWQLGADCAEQLGADCAEAQPKLRRWAAKARA